MTRSAHERSVVFSQTLGASIIDTICARTDEAASQMPPVSRWHVTVFLGRQSYSTAICRSWSFASRRLKLLLLDLVSRVPGRRLEHVRITGMFEAHRMQGMGDRRDGT